MNERKPLIGGTRFGPMAIKSQDRNNSSSPWGHVLSKSVGPEGLERPRACSDPVPDSAANPGTQW